MKTRNMRDFKLREKFPILCPICRQVMGQAGQTQVGTLDDDCLTNSVSNIILRNTALCKMVYDIAYRVSTMTATASSRAIPFASAPYMSLQQSRSYLDRFFARYPNQYPNFS
jgi:hypothetical protein